MNIARVESRLVVLSEEDGVSSYDFDFDLHFSCSHPHRIDGEEPCVLRVGPVRDYAREFGDRLAMGLRLVNSPAEHTLASEIESWYPHLRARRSSRRFRRLGRSKRRSGGPCF